MPDGITYWEWRIDNLRALMNLAYLEKDRSDRHWKKYFTVKAKLGRYLR